MVVLDSREGEDENGSELVMVREVDVLIGSTRRGWKRRWDLIRHIRRVWLIDGGALGERLIVRWQVRMD